MYTAKYAKVWHCSTNVVERKRRRGKRVAEKEGREVKLVGRSNGEEKSERCHKAQISRGWHPARSAPADPLRLPFIKLRSADIPALFLSLQQYLSLCFTNDT